jgi:putative transposase
LKRLKELEEENRRLKQMYANLSLEHAVLNDIIEKKRRWCIKVLTKEGVTV